MIITAKCDMCGKEGDAKSVQRGYDDIDKCDKCRLEQDLIILKSQEETQTSIVRESKKTLKNTKQQIKETEMKLNVLGVMT